MLLQPRREGRSWGTQLPASAEMVNQSLLSCAGVEQGHCRQERDLGDSQGSEGREGARNPWATL